MKKKSGFCPIGKGVIPANQEQCSSISRLLLGSQYQMGATPHPRLPPSRESSLFVVTHHISFLYLPQLFGLWTIFLLNLEQMFFHQGRHLQSLLVISSNSAFPPPLAFAKCVLGESLLRRFRSFYTREIQFHPTFVFLARVGWM